MQAIQNAGRHAKRLLRDRRGASSLMFTGLAVTLFGAVALATDAGLTYSAKRGAQNAADASATAAAVSLAMGGRDVAIATGRDIAGRNGFVHAGATTVAVNVPPASGPRASDSSAVEVIVSQTQTLGPSGLFISTPPTVRGRAVASLLSGTNVCILSLTGPVTAGGNTVVNTPNCVIASNMRGAGSIAVNGGSLDLTAFTLSAVGSCVNCNTSSVILTEAFREWQVPAENPYAHLDSKTLPPLGNNSINASSINSGTLLPYELNGGRVLRGDLKITGQQVLSLQPGTYYIYNGNFDVQSGTVNCPTCTGTSGVTIVLGGSPSSIGGITINANAVVNLRAPANPADSAFRGVLFYRSAAATSNSTSNPPVKINGGGTLSLAGGMYFPRTHVRVNGNSGSVVCSVLVAASIEFTGNANVTGCATMGTPVPRTRAVVMAE
jgi:Flp pilus assembly protein TadG